MYFSGQIICVDIFHDNPHNFFLIIDKHLTGMNDVWMIQLFQGRVFILNLKENCPFIKISYKTHCHDAFIFQFSVNFGSVNRICGFMEDFFHKSMVSLENFRFMLENIFFFPKLPHQFFLFPHILLHKDHLGWYPVKI